VAAAIDVVWYRRIGGLFKRTAKRGLLTAAIGKENVTVIKHGEEEGKEEGEGEAA
jgi:hypothetical protein